MAGYSPTPLVKKLGIKAGDRVRVEGAPNNYREMLSPLPVDVTISNRLTVDIQVWHLFSMRRAHLEKRVPLINQRLADTAMLWVSWYKKSSVHATDITEDTLREIALPIGLVDVKVCAVDEDWSALKLVRRKELRG
jgi:hypothetical protein